MRCFKRTQTRVDRSVKKMVFGAGLLSVTHQRYQCICGCIRLRIYLFSYGGVNARAYDAYSYGRTKCTKHDKDKAGNKMGKMSVRRAYFSIDRQMSKFVHSFGKFGSFF